MTGVHEPHTMASVMTTFVTLAKGVLTQIFKTVFVWDARQMVTRSAMLLLSFLVVHVAGNLVFFAGQDEFNKYAAFLEALPIIKFIEVRGTSDDWCIR